MLADRFAPELIYTVTQTVDPSQEGLSGLTTHLNARGRIHIMKSLALLKSKVVKECQKRLLLQFSPQVLPPALLNQTLHQSLQNRLNSN